MTSPPKESPLANPTAVRTASPPDEAVVSGALTGAGSSQDKPPERYFNFLGLVIVRKADMLAATAFLLAMASTIYQLSGYLWGAHLRVFSPDRVMIFFDHYSDGEIVTRFGGQLTFVNSGAQGRSGTVRDAWINVAVDKENTEEHWSAFPKLSRDGIALTIKADDEAFPLEVPGEGTVSKYTTFAPRVERCKMSVGAACNPTKQFVSDTQFLDQLNTQLGKSITVTFRGRTFQSGTVAPSSCSIDVTEALLTFLAANDWYSAPCSSLN